MMPSTNGKSQEEEVSAEELERKHFQHVINVFMAYKKFSVVQIERKRKCLLNLPKHHQAMIPTQFERIKDWQEALDTNQSFLSKIVEYTKGMFVNSNLEGSDDSSPITSDDIDRVRTTIKQCVRDWSIEGAEERNNTYKLITDELIRLFPVVANRKHIDILVPGAGLGRLMHDIARLGFCCQGNEFSLYMLFASNYILNTCGSQSMDTILPWLHQTVNVVSNDDQTRGVSIPDINPQDLDGNCNFSMAAGDFLEVYREPSCWNVVAMSFFLDTAHNVIEYIERAHYILKPGGYLIHLGPLLYHFAGMEKEQSIELTYDEVKHVMINHFNFKLIKEELGVKSSYIRNVRSMFTVVYNCAFLVLQKPAEPM
ncbi:carnosine N-methyltransferase-like [Clytia hemisphaerica]|uniref:carnosine N-methyltransferase-like n=1 Tax=Clytia hemisphaerica TaxID=252671 RepID=UPI0034D6D743